MYLFTVRLASDTSKETCRSTISLFVDDCQAATVDSRGRLMMSGARAFIGDVIMNEIRAGRDGRIVPYHH